jgi:hypothetical protein
MLLRAQAFGYDPFRRFLILRIEDRTLWDGEAFTDEFDQAQKFYRPSDACFEIQRIMKEQYKSQRHRKYVVPVEVDVYGDVTPKQVAEYLRRASVLSVRVEEFGNGPTADSYVAPVIHWGYLKPIDVLKEDPDNPALDWGIGPDIENL